MTEDPKIAHIQDRRRSPAPTDDDEMVSRIADAVGMKLDLKLSRHFKEQNDILRNGIQRLLNEVDGVRSGRAEEAFARVAPANTEADLPTIEADAALHYPHSAEDIARELGGILSANEVGTLLGDRGLKWANHPNYQEMTRYKVGRTRFWHHTVPGRLDAILRNPPPDMVDIEDKRIRAIVRKYRRKLGLAEVVRHPGS